MPAITLGVVAWILGAWIIDDAGISFAYSRNFAAGRGFVAQAGRPEVEGFSNFTWVLALAPWFVARAFHPVWIPKILGGACAVAGIFLLARSVRDLRLRLGVSIALAASPPIAIWALSGLENGLFLLLGAALFSTLIGERPDRGARAGIFAALVAMTRPDGIVFVVVPPIAAIVRASRSAARPRPWRSAAREASTSIVFAGTILAAFFAFRYATFGRWWPHPYEAKREHASIAEQIFFVLDRPSAAADKALDLWRGAGGAAGPVIAGLVALASIDLARKRALPADVLIAQAHHAIALAAVVIMDPDWMGEHRFGTLAVAFGITASARTFEAWIQASREDLRGREGAAGVIAKTMARAVSAAIAAGTALIVLLFFTRILAFSANPPTPFGDVGRDIGAKVEAYGRHLGIARPSILLADVGAPLYADRLVVHDLAGLTEPEVVRTLKGNTPVWLDAHPAFYDWVFDEVRPTFISTHHFWTFVSALEQDPRFEADYVAIDAYEDDYVRCVFGRTMRSGDFVRRDAITDARALRTLRAAWSGPRRGSASPSFGPCADARRP